MAEQFLQSVEPGVELADLGQDGRLLVLDEVFLGAHFADDDRGGRDRGEEREAGDPDEHEGGAEDAAADRDRHVVAVAHGGHGRDRPPPSGADVREACRIGPVHRETTEQDHGRADQSHRQ